MNLGISTWGFFTQRDPATWSTLAEAVDDILAMDEGLGVEVWGSRSFEEPPVAGKDLVQLVAACQEAEFVTVHTQGRYWSWHPVGLRREIDFAHQLGAETLVLHPVCLGLEQPEDRPDWPEIVRIAEYAAKFGVRLAVENTFHSVWCLDRILETIGDDPEKTNVGICIDVGHAALSKDAGREPVCNYLDRYAAQLVHLHLHDNHGDADDHLVPGDGIIDWPRALHKIQTLGFDGTAILEIHGSGGKPQEAIQRAIAFLDR